MQHLSAIDMSPFDHSFDTTSVLAAIRAGHKGIEPPALAALDMALWTLESKIKGKPISTLLGMDHRADHSVRTYTISVCDKAEMAERIAYGQQQGFTTFKLKLDGKDDRRIIDDFRGLSDAPFAVDANQSWTDLDQSIAFAHELESRGCVLIEQPFGKDKTITTTFQLKRNIKLPVIADEACQRHGDVDSLELGYSGINVKLQKCGGLAPAYKMIKHARAKGLKILIGCMSESEIGCDAAQSLTPLCDWNDLDGKYLVKEVPFKN